MKKKRISGVLCCLVAAVCLLSGCAQKPDSASDQSSGTASEPGPTLESNAVNTSSLISEPVSTSGDNANSIFLNIASDWQFRLENAKGQFITYDGTEITGTMKHWDAQSNVEDSTDLLLRVPASETLTLIPRGSELKLAVTGPTQWCYIDGEGITSVVIGTDHVSLEGNFLDFCLIHRLDDSASGYLSGSSLPYVRLEAHAEKSVTMTPSATKYHIEGITGGYTLQTLSGASGLLSRYATGDVLTKVTGVAVAGEVISQPISGSGQAGESDPDSPDNSDYLLLDIARTWVGFRLENAEGKYLEWTGMDPPTGTLDHWDLQSLVGSSELLLRVPVSETYILTPEQGDLCFSVSSPTQWSCVESTTIESVTIKRDSIILQGNEMYFTMIHRKNDSPSGYLHESSLPYMLLDCAYAEKTAAITATDTNYTFEGLSGFYKLQTFSSMNLNRSRGVPYLMDENYTNADGVAEAGQVISCPIFSSKQEKPEFVLLDVVRHGRFRVENAEGEFLYHDGSGVSGTMKCLGTMYAGTPASILLRIPASETLKFTPEEEEMAFSTSGPAQWNYVEGTGITSVVVENGRVSLEGDSLDFYLLYRPNNDSSLPYVRLEAHAEGTATMTSSETDFTVEGITGDYTLQTMYSKDDVLTEEVGTAEPGEVISQPIRGR